MTLREFILRYPIASNKAEIEQQIQRLPRPSTLGGKNLPDTLMREVVVSLPREERVFEDSTFRAVVSGYRPSLDTMQVYQRHSVVKVTERITPSRWSLGLQGGVGVTPKGIQPYIGVGVAYRLNIK